MITIKTPAEIEKIRQACRVVAQVLQNIEKEIKIGITTEELDRFAEDLILKCNCSPAFKGYRGYTHSTCISVNFQVVHGIPSKLKLKDGDIVSFDVGTVFEGYYGDGARTFPVGNVSGAARKLLSTTKEALKKAISQARYGKNLGDISYTIEKVAADAGFSVVKDLFGHGVGNHLHEDPLIPNFGKRGTGAKLKAGMVLAIEPMLNMGRSRVITLDDGWTVATEDRMLSAHFEDTIVVTDGDPEILTKAFSNKG
ncbi:type I methionyl aminopeptidase [candidate division WOR-1 bacterium RIFOXYC2_FULL_37_10]|uniref:Methionine aminopeptidase n=1 Tax=candidate division WOR-1 bacterium RIFOXYB2_FULL_37_13 TaxID=1802579 RepID=A0A1F4SRW4_UNCSA|nr:MAG: type I methionyl aminopeptidase [candidate division WOR-1 bacterium RIFOXYA2_FULL_37_7]OGC23195.1 MAG: type I methionyl aminopeptidase [candidate division WOR-1 bacterium RIFOXYB2_FULL_37_13]OGC37034.1 MAG: type I methionyl aminopeptidase [candidate division WOR-1 bacterium RIFOXYC2_FULL_37_10]